MTCLPSLFYGYLLGIGVQKLKAHYLWTLSALYRVSILKSALIAAFLFSAATSAYISIVSDVSLHYWLLPISFAVLGLFANNTNALLHNILRNIYCTSLLILIMLEVTHQLAQYIIIISALAFTYWEFKGRTRLDRENPVNLAPDSQSMAWWNKKLATFVTKYHKGFSKDIAWAICYPQTKQGFIASYSSLIMFLVAGIDNSEVLLGFIMLAMVVGCQFPVYQEFVQLKHQVKAIAHSYKTAQDLIKDILFSFDKIVLKNTLILFIILVVVSWIKLPDTNPSNLIIIGVLATIYFLAFSPLF